MTDRYSFTYEYGNGDGDRYSGEVYAANGTYFVWQEILLPTPNITGNQGKYTITSVSNVDSAHYAAYEGNVYVGFYEDAVTSTGELGYSAIYGHAGVSADGYGGLGSESGYAYGQLKVQFTPYYQADLISPFSLTSEYDYVYGLWHGGNDTIVGAFTDLLQNDYVDGGEAIDTLIINGDSEYLVEVYAGNGINQLNIPGTEVYNFENFDFSGFTTDVNFYGAAGNNTFLGGLAIDTVDYTGLGAKVTLTARGIIEKDGLGQDVVRADIIIGDAGFTNAINASSSSTTPIVVDLSTGSLTVGLPSGDATFAVINFVDVTGSQLADTITGDDQDNTFSGQAGDDFFIGSGGSDIIIGGNDLDTVDYSQLEAQITLKAQGIIEKEGIGSDTVQVETIIGNGNFKNVIDASLSETNAIAVDLSINSLTVAGLFSGDATFTVANFVDVIGTQTDDTIKGNGDDNTLDGQEGDDEFFGTDGNDNIIGGDGFDSLNYDGYLAGAITLKALGIIDKGDLGIDTVQVETVIGNSEYVNVIDASDSTTKSITVDLATNLLTVTDIGSFNVFNFTNVIGTSLADSIKGNALNNYLDGKSGNDTLIGGVGADTLQGGIGIDTASYASASGAINVSLSTGKGTLGDAKDDVLLSIENVTGSGFDDNITGSALANTLDGGVGEDILSGAGGNDSLLGGDGNDNLTGGADADTLNGGNGTDTASYSSAVTVSLTTGTGTLGEAIGDVLSNIENLTGSNSSDSLTGSSVSNALVGNGGNDTLTGLGGKDTLTGGSGRDKFGYKILGDSLFANFDVVKDFKAVDDYFLIASKPSSFVFSNVGTVSALTLTGIGAKLTSTTFKASNAAQFSFGARSFVAINNSLGGFLSTTDAIIEVTGLSGTLTAGNFVIA